MADFRVRASGLAMFFDCPSRWAAVTLDGKRTPSGVPSLIGTGVHGSTAAFDSSRLNSNEQTWISADDAADVLEQTLKNPTEEVDWTGWRLDKAMTVGLGVHTRYCNEIAPLKDYVAVEQTLQELVVNVPCNAHDPEETLSIELTGTLDRVYEEATEYRDEQDIPLYHHAFGIADVKTGARACSMSVGKHKAQIGVYELLAEHNGHHITLPGEIIQLQTSSNYQAAVEPLYGARIALLGFEGRTGLLEHMARMLKTGDFFGNASSFLCTEKYCANYTDCMFR